MFQSALTGRLTEPVVLISGKQAAQSRDDELTNLRAQNPAGVSLEWSVADSERATESMRCQPQLLASTALS